MLLLVLASCISVALGANCHGHTVETLIAHIASDTDKDGNGFITLDEFQNELLGQFDPLGTGTVTRADFVNQFSHLYGDSHADAHHLFDNLDSNRDHVLTEADIIGQIGELNLNFLALLNPSAINIPMVDFLNFLRINHPHHGNPALHNCPAA
ncbi:uncharacterized protein LOC128238706 [Mya arenaria]|uniref:uncharacterized protein LOC128238706 n=1 Tax=Mya arenaria TaxID=6604 RepID=UPI0022E34698|nr:uncharacterized protein LOC128238706 [Mya arenaria]